LWSMADVPQVAAIDPDHVVWSDGPWLVVHRWR
jgi:hypothetical protein